MELTKRRYKRQEVESILTAYKTQYDKVIAEYKTRIKELVNQNGELVEQVERLNQKEKLVLATLERAEQTSSALIEQAEMQYALELEALKKFNADWKEYFEKLQEKYPSDKFVKNTAKIKERLENFPKKKNPKKAVQELSDLISDKAQEFNPKSKIQDYIAATSDSAFNMEEVLNPGKLELEDLCKELGLIEK